MKTKLAAAAILFGVISGCGGGSSPSTPTPAAAPAPTPGPTASRLTLGVVSGTNTFTVHSSTQVVNLTLLCGDFSAQWEIIESAGLSATITQGEAYLLAANGDITDRRITPSTAVIPAGGKATTSTDRTTCGYVGRELPMNVVLILTVRDANGNVSTLRGQTGFVQR